MRTIPAPHPRAELIARAFHETYEDLAPSFGYRTRSESAVPWEDLPTANKLLMVATITTLLGRVVIR
jgi:hypothetical protein